MNRSVIILNGPSSSGKSTLAKVLQQVLESKRAEGYIIISIDDYLQMNTQETIYEEDVFEINAPLCLAAIDALRCGKGVIIDHVMTSPRIYQDLLAGLGDHRTHLVRIDCPLEELERREHARQNRRIGSARASYQYLYPKEGYALTVDTHSCSIQECARKIADFLDSAPPTS